LIICSLQYYLKLKIFKLEIEDYEEKLTEAYYIAKEDFLNEINRNSNRLNEKVRNYFSDQEAFVTIDTTFKYCLIKSRVPYCFPSVQYFKFLKQKSLLDIKNESNNELINKFKQRLSLKYPEQFDIWYDKLLNNKIVIEKDSLIKIGRFTEYLTAVNYEPEVWKAFDEFLRYYERDIARIKSSNKKVYGQMENAVYTLKNQLRSSYRNHFIDVIEEKKNNLIKKETLSRSFESNLLELLSYTIDSLYFDKDLFNTIAEEELLAQWRTNSLNTGAKPYAYCYGYSNRCSGWGCSKIEINNGGSDVVILVKNTHNHRITRHSYIRSGDRYTINLPNGSYIVYFYSGKGWNPSKVIKESPCTVKGGFVSQEHTGKDSKVHLNNNILQYTLYEVVNGNFSMLSSSKDEAFN